MTKNEILTQFEADCKLQGGSTEAIRKAMARAIIEITYDHRNVLQALAETIEDRLTRIGDIIEKANEPVITGEEIKPEVDGVTAPGEVKQPE